jgi:8-oxo-dGTP diphosphatase
MAQVAGRACAERQSGAIADHDMHGATSPTIVTAAVIERDGLLLVARRLEDTHMGGYWEFPGGKCEAGESAEACLARELFEELGATAAVHEEIYRTAYAYDDRVLDLRFFRCDLTTEPRAVLGQEIRWVARHELPTLEFPPADRELIARLSAPR